MKKLIIYILLGIVVSSCKKTETQLPDAGKYKYPIPAVKLTTNANVGAYYLNYASSDWSKAQSDTSLLGKPYNAVTDASIFPKQMTWADEAGVDYFIFKWNASATDKSLLTSFASRRTNQKVKMVIGYNTAHLSATNASPLTGAKLQTMIDEWKVLVQDHVSKDYYYKIGNRPVILLTPLNLSSSALTSIDHKMVVETLRTELKKLGVDPFIIGEFTTGWTAPANFVKESMAAMDAIVLTSWNTADYDRWWAFHSFVDLNWKNWKKTLDSYNVEFIPCIFPGYNEPSVATQRIFERTEANYIDFSNVAKGNLGKSNIVIINSWNDFSKGTALEPSKKFQQKYLELTRREFKVQQQ